MSLFDWLKENWCFRRFCLVVFDRDPAKWCPNCGMQMIEEGHLGYDREDYDYDEEGYSHRKMCPNCDWGDWWWGDTPEDEREEKIKKCGREGDGFDIEIDHDMEMQK